MEQFVSFAPMLVIVVVMYFLMIRPQQKKIKQEKEFNNALKVGDKVITKSGIHGRLAELTEETVVIETMAGKLKFERSAISDELSKKVSAKA
ncbi:preprotein translocase subunit YajC [Flavobacterium sp. RNTU_13]|uniref:preprotein translocase subunit YajC n=1 Tax=Flavobacterium sp. RNTU_13 TaxID=3375145 RepID=UPI003988225D